MYEKIISEFFKANEIEVDAEKIKSLSTTLGEKVKPEIKLDTVKDFLAKNDAGKEYYSNAIKEVKTSALEEYKKSDEYKTTFETAKTEAAKLAEAKVREELGKKLTPEQKKIKELEEKQAKTEAEMRAKDIKFVGLAALEEKKLPKDLIDLVLDPTDEVKTVEKIETLSEIVTKQVKIGVEQEFKKIGRNPNASGGDQAPIKVTQAMLDKAADKARASGKMEDRLAYVQIKRIYNSQKEE